MERNNESDMTQDPARNAGLEVSKDTIEKAVEYVKRCQNPDGGFSGREGGSDLYYTGFALRTLAVLQHLNPPICERAAVYLRSQLAGSATVIDFFSFLVGAFLVRIAGGPDVLAGADAHWPDHVAIALETHRNSDGGYSRSPGGSSGSTYTTFIVALALELLGKQVPDVTNATRFVEARRRGGGFVEIPQMKRAGTNPTAAGFGSLQILGAIDNVSIDVRREVVDFLVGMRSSSESV